ncbi:MAG: efflux RND transporter permease subunit [Elusimicrobiota bacterium]|jgi:HAE1 family hydrophobic/amphiphilic exporter-1|nr:efflux RND transporter permease subunit [Elusimicrobiota bacterium]
MSLGTVSIKRPTFIVSILLALLVLGVTFYSKMNVRMMPDVDFPYVLIMTTYNGAGAEEIEQQVTKPMEDALSGISGIKHINSVNQDSVSIIFLEFELSVSQDVAAQDVRDKIGTVRNLPDDMDTPIIMKIDMNSMPLMGFALKADMDPVDLYDFANDIVSNDLSEVNGVSQVSIVGGSQREIHVDADKKKLKEYQVSLSAISAKINSNSLNIPSGTINRGTNEMSYRTIGEFQSVKEINDVIVNFSGNDIPIKVSDVATVKDAIKDVSTIGRITYRKDKQVVKENSILLMVSRQAKSNDVKISDDLKKRMTQLNKQYSSMKGSPDLTMTFDQADPIRKNIADVLETIVVGILLAVLVVYFFLGSWRSTFITALALPNSLIGSFVFMYLAGFSINVLSLMSLSLAVGLLIDDAIVVRENIYRHYEKGKNPIAAAIDGTHEVTLAVIATTAAVIAVFGPVGFLGGLMGKMFREFGLTIVFAMTISILDALTIAPMLSAYLIPTHEKVAEDAKKTGTFRNFWRGVTKVFRACTVDWFEKVFAIVLNFYTRIITKIVKNHTWRIATILIAVFVFIFTIGLAKKTLKSSFMPASSSNTFTITATGTPGTSITQMNKYADEIETIIMEDSSVEMISSSIGSTGFLSSGDNLASFNVNILPSNERKATSDQIRDNMRKKLKEKFGDEIDFEIKNQQGMGADSDLTVELRGADLDTLYDVSRVLMEKYKDIPHLVDIHSNFSMAKPEIQVRLDKMKIENLGVNSVDAGTEIRAMIDGALSGKFRQNGNEYDIRVQLNKNQKDIVHDMADTYIFNVNGRLISIDKVANLVQAGAPVTIYRKDKQRFINIEGNLEEGGVTSDAQKAAIEVFNEEKAKPENAEKWKDVQISLSGDAENMAEMFQSIIIAMGLSILFIFLVLASLYESIVTPLVIMSALPLAIIGGLFALIMTRQPIDMFTLIGMVMLLGIVAKNSILLIDYAQQKIRGGMEISDALIKAGDTRLRPILMTSFALIMGMLPTALALSEVGEMRKGMGIVVIGGVISSTILTLLVVPAIFEYMDIFRRFLRRIMKRPENRMIDHTEEELKKMNL